MYKPALDAAHSQYLRHLEKGGSLMNVGALVTFFGRKQTQITGDSCSLTRITDNHKCVA